MTALEIENNMKKKFKILHVESHPQWGGQEMRVFNESRWMHQRGHHIIIAAPENSMIYKKAVIEGWEVYSFAFKRLTMIADIYRMRYLLKKINPDVLNPHGNTDAKVALTAAWGLNIPCIIKSRHSTPSVRNSWYNRLLYKKLCHFIFTTSDFITKQLIKDLGVSKERIYSLPSPFIPPVNMPEHKTARQNLTVELGLNLDTKFIGNIGRLSNEKGLPVLINAFARISHIIPDYNLVLVGEGALLSKLKTLSREKNILKKVHFTGFRDNPWPYFRAFDCHVLASIKYEAVPQVIIQAMYAGCPVIGSDTGGIPDIINEKTGLLVPPDNAELLAEAILKTIKEPESAKRRANQAYQYAKNNYSIDIMSEKILNVYKQKFS